MNNYRIIFEDLWKLSNQLTRGVDDTFIDYLNSFHGGNTLEKFKSILKCWDVDVSSFITFNFEDKPIKIQVTYILSQLQGESSEDITISDNGTDIIVGVPDRFQIIDHIPVYNIIKSINIHGIYIDFNPLSIEDRKLVMDKLPPTVYNILYNGLLQDTTKIISMDNPTLKDFRLNLLSNDVYTFLRGLFCNFDEYYFKDVIFHLSKRIGGDILLNSTPSEIQYYVELYSKELNNQNDSLTI